MNLTAIPPGEGELIGDAPERRVEILWAAGGGGSVAGVLVVRPDQAAAAFADVPQRAVERRLADSAETLQDGADLGALFVIDGAVSITTGDECIRAVAGTWVTLECGPVTVAAGNEPSRYLRIKTTSVA